MVFPYLRLNRSGPESGGAYGNGWQKFRQWHLYDSQKKSAARRRGGPFATREKRPVKSGLKHGIWSWEFHPADRAQFPSKAFANNVFGMFKAFETIRKKYRVSLKNS